MKILIPLFACLAACASPDSALSTEMAELRRELQEVRKVAQPRLDAVEAMDDLAREVKQLKQKLSNPPPAPVMLPVPGNPLAPLKTDAIAGGVGSSQAGLQDLYWVLSRVQVNGEERTVLSLYRATPQGIRLESVRLLNPDLQLIEYNGTKPTVKDVVNTLEKQKK